MSRFSDIFVLSLLLLVAVIVVVLGMIVVEIVFCLKKTKEYFCAFIFFQHFCLIWTKYL